MEKENKVINEILETFENKAAELPACARALQLYNDRKYDEAVACQLFYARACGQGAFRRGKN